MYSGRFIYFHKFRGTCYRFTIYYYSDELDVMTGFVFRDLLSYSIVRKWFLPEFAARPFCRNQLKNLLTFISGTS